MLCFAATAPTAKLHIGGTAGTDGLKFPDGSLQKYASTLINSYFAITPATVQTITSTTPTVVTGLSITLTPRSASSKFLIMAVVNGSSSYVQSVLVYRNNATILTHGNNSNEPGSMVTLYNNDNITNTMRQSYLNYMDAPNTTASITYDIRVTSGWANTANTTYINDRATSDMRTPSTLTILEFAQ